MHSSTISPQIRIPATALVFAFLLVLQIPGCQKGPQQKQEAGPKVTYDNLQIAYGKSVNRAKMYTLFAKQADKENMKNIAALYRAISRSEEIHAQKHAELMRSGGVEPVSPAPESLVVGRTLQTLKMAMSYEEQEYGSMYPNLLHSANLEKFQAAVTQFQHTEDADSKHGELLREAITKFGAIPLLKYYVCPECGYLMLTDKTEECPTCQTKKAKFEKI